MTENGIQIDAEKNGFKQKMSNLLHTLAHSPTDGDLAVTDFDIFWINVSIIARLVNIAFSIAVAIDYYRQGQQDYFAWSLGCLLIPMIITTGLLLTMQFEDKKLSKKYILWHILWFLVLVPFLFRYSKSLYYAMSSRRGEKQNNEIKRKKYLELLIQEDSDVALLRIFECFFEVAPQKILHISIILMSSTPPRIYQIIFILSAMVSMAWCIASYHRCMRFSQINKNNLSWYGTISQWMWHFSITVSRVLSIACIASLFPHWTLIACAIHAIVMALWLFIWDRSPFCAATTFTSFIFSILLGIVFIFNYILPRDRRTRYRYTIYYTICFVENVVCLALFIIYSSASQKEKFYFMPLCILAFVAYFCGLLFMIIYYVRFHPNVMAKRTDRRSNIENEQADASH